MPDQSSRIGPSQRHALVCLRLRGTAALTDWGAWYPLNEAQARGAVERLSLRGLVDVAGWDDGPRGGSRTYKLTEQGRHLIDALTETDDSDA